LLMGDEVRRTQRGNNNGYCQDNEISWFDWTLLEAHRGLHRFVKTLVHQRLMLGNELGVEGLSLNEILREAEIQLHGVNLNRPDLSPESHSLAITVRGKGRTALFHAMFNSYWEALIFELPSIGAGLDQTWRRWIDTHQDAPHDIYDWPGGPAVEGTSYTLQARSLVLLFAVRDYAACRTANARSNDDPPPS